MAGINQIQQERAARPAISSGPSNNLFLKNGDIAFLHFIGTGNDNDPYLEVFLAHELPPSGENQWPQPVYCPVLSQHDEAYPCPNCGHEPPYKTKERMRMWFYVSNILHRTQRDGDNLPQVQFGGQTYFNREVNRPLVWDNSAWRESPLDAIIFEYSTSGNLRNSQYTLRASGEGKDRRYRLTPMSGSTPFDEGLLAKFKDDIKPIRELLLAEIRSVETIARPTEDTPQFNPAGAAPLFPPAQNAPQTDPALLASAPPPDFNPAALAAPPSPFEPPVGVKPTY